MRHSPRRKLTLPAGEFVWSLAGNTLYGSNRHIVVRIPGLPGRLLIDPFPWDLEIRPAMVAEAIEFALAEGWRPAKKAPPVVLGRHRGAFFILPVGVKFTHEIRDSLR